jgi:hypothetical protein
MPRRLNARAEAWRQHVMKVWRANPGMSYGQAMKLASKSWRKGGARGGARAPMNPVADGRKYKTLRQGGSINPALLGVGAGALGLLGLMGATVASQSQRGLF